MRPNTFTRHASLSFKLIMLLVVSALLAPNGLAVRTPRMPTHAALAANVSPTFVFPVLPVQAGSVGVNGFFSVNQAQQGSSFQAAVVLDIPGELHVNSNRPLGKYAIPTTVRVEAPRGIRTTAVAFPRASVRSFRFGEGAPAERLAVFEGRTIMRFNVSVPANYQTGVTNIRVVVRYQSCSDTVCFPPASRELSLPIAIVGRDTPVQRINGQYFGGGVRGRRR